MKSVDIKGKAYIEVNERLKEFRNNQKYNGYSLETEIVQLENGICTMKAIIKDANDRTIATGYAQEKENSSFINKTSYIENCETSAWGRALGNLGIGIDTSVASADEVMNAINNQFNSDEDLIAGLDGIADLANLKKYYQDNYSKAVNKDAFAAAKDKRKAQLQ